MAKNIKNTDKELLKQTVQMVQICSGNISMAARRLGELRQTVSSRYHRAVELGLDTNRAKPFETEFLPNEVPSADELLEKRKHQFKRKAKAKEARKLINVKIKIDGPIGIAHLGDPHVDDDGTDINLLETHVKTINDTEGMFGANVGDMSNNWIGRLARLYGEQSTTAAEAWVLVEWLVNSVDWIYLLGGNHDCWSGAGDPIQWMLKSQSGVYEAHGARLNLNFPNTKKVIINARHDFAGHSMWNTAHGLVKAAQMGWRDHILTAGHKHVSGYQVVKCPATGLITHALRLASYKIYDRYAEEKGLPDQNISPAFVTVIDPKYTDSDPRLVTTIFDVEEGAEFLKWKRNKK